MNNLTIVNRYGKLLVDSREVSEMIGKDHNILLRDIRNYISQMVEANKDCTDLHTPKINTLDYFIESAYINSQNKEQPCYFLTKIGCDFVANKMTGVKGTAFTAIYTKEFNEMEKELLSERKLLSPKEQLKLQLELIEEQDKKIDEVVKNVDDLKSNMPLFNTDCKDLQGVVKKIATKSLGGYKSPAYSDNSLRGKVYSDIQNQLKREFGVERYESIKRSQLETAKNIVQEYKAPMVLVNEISIVNSK